MLAGLLDPPFIDKIMDWIAGKPKDTVDSGGLTIGRGSKDNASEAGQAAYAAVNLAFTFASEAIESGLRKVGGAIKSAAAAVWRGIGEAVMDAIKAPAFLFVGAGGVGGGSRGAMSAARRAARSGAVSEALESLRAGNPTPQAAHLADRIEAVYGREALVEFMDTGKLPKGIEFSHLFSASEYPEFAHRSDLGVLTDQGEHRLGHHGGDTSVPLHGRPRIPGKD